MIFPRLLSPTPQHWRIEQLHCEHAGACGIIHAGSFARPWDHHEFERLIASANIVADGAFSGPSASPQGFAISRIVLDEAEILTIAIARSARGQGTGSRLLSAHLENVAIKGAKMIFLEVESENTPALALYRRQGFEEIGRRQGYYAKPDGTLAHALTMRLTIR